MTPDSYPAARIAAPRVHEHFAQHRQDAEREGAALIAALPDVAAIERIIDVSFWASLRREEGYVPAISVAFLPPEQDPNPMRFNQPLTFTPGVLAKIAPVVERPGIHLGVWPIDGELAIWGTTRTIPAFCFVIEVVEPGLLVVKHARGERTGKYVNVAVLEGDQCKIIDENAKSLPDCPSLLTSLLGFDTPTEWGKTISVLVQLAVSMRAHGRGGSLLIVPSATETWRESIASPIAYAITPPFREFAKLLREPDADPVRLRETIDHIGGLTAADGATMMTDTFELLAFGAKIVRRWQSPQVEQVTVTEPIESNQPRIISPAQLGGTRHSSAAQFVHDQRDAVALVASQDRRFTIFAWSPCENRVHAHRVETLLL
jgi:hypothetical protein